jgi:hypothetical protein
LNAEHRAGPNGFGILGFLTAANASALAQTSKRGAQVVREFEWADNTLIKGKLADWHSRFPNATIANLKGRTDLDDSDFIYLRGIKKLNISGCTGITDVAFEQIRGVEELDMSDLPEITDVAISNLEGIQILNMSGCTGITGATFMSIRGVHDLFISGCTGIRGENFEHLAGVFHLNMELAQGGIEYAHIRDEHYRFLKGINTLNISNITAITDAAFTENFSSLQILDMNGCSGITGTGFRFLTDIKVISMTGDMGTFAEDNFRHISATINSLTISNGIFFTDNAFEHFKHLSVLDMSSCTNSHITDVAFSHLSNLIILNMMNCNQPTITDSAFSHLANLRILIMINCNQRTITGGTFGNLVNIEKITTRGCNPDVIAAAEALLEARRARQNGGKRKVKKADKKADRRSRKARKSRKNRRTKRR